MSGEDGMVHLALGFGEGGVVEVVVVGMGRVMELDEGLQVLWFWTGRVQVS